MGILELMLGNSEPGEQGVEGKSYALPKETHDFVYRRAVRREEVAAFAELLAAEADAPPMADASGDLQSVFDGLVGEGGIDADELADQMSQPREAIEPMIETWTETIDRDIGVVYARVGPTRTCWRSSSSASNATRTTTTRSTSPRPSRTRRRCSSDSRREPIRSTARWYIRISCRTNSAAVAL